jgi:ribonucleoside-diphosphate reductase alpha chain
MKTESSLNLSSVKLSTQIVCEDVLKEKYLKGNETCADDIFLRASKAIASVEKDEDKQLYEGLFLQNMRNGAIGAGRIMSSAGSEISGATLINCFVQPVGDCIQGVDDEGFPGIYEALRESAETMRRGGGVGYDFSRIRPRGAFVKGTSSMASGPCSYINVFDQSCQTVESAGARRGAQMGVLRIDHPDVREFIVAKRTPGRWNNFNVSVGMLEVFMQAVESDADWELVHKAAPNQAKIDAGAHKREDGLWVYETLKAKELWDIIMTSTYDFAEPGILFLDNINQDNNLRYCEKIEATNPCGEQPLPSYGCCDLGPVILTRFVKNPFGFNGDASFDFEAFAKAVALQVRVLDNVLDLTYWPLKEQSDESAAKRRIGVGYTGLGNALTMLKLRYDQEDGRDMARKISIALRDASYNASIDLGIERGVFPKFNAAGYLAEGTFASRLPDAIKARIAVYGIRNSHLLSIAPTGTVSLAFADNASNGIEPAFSWSYKRTKRMADGSKLDYAVEDHSWRLFRELGGDVDNLPDYFVSAMSMSAQAHVLMMATCQPYVDTAISKTVNVPADYPFDDFKDLYMQAWKAGLKGLATYRPNAVLGSVLSVDTPKVVAVVTPVAASVVAAVDPMRAVIEKRPVGVLNSVSEKIEYWTQEGRKTVYLSVSFLPVITETCTAERAIEFFMPASQSSESQQWLTSTMRMLSLTARGGFLERALNDLRKVAWDRGPVRLGAHQKDDGTLVPMWHDSEVAALSYAIQCIISNRAKAKVVDTLSAQSDKPAERTFSSEIIAGKKCSECGAHAVIKKDGCDFCTSCGHLGTCG